MSVNKKKINMIVVILLVICFFVSATGFALATNEGVDNTNNTPHISRDKTNVILSKDEKDEKKIHVYLGMADDVSIESFQIGLDINVNDSANVKFNWSDSLKEGCYRDYRYSTKKDSVSGENNERLNIYYVGTEELNTNNVDIIEIGTIDIELSNDIQSQLVISSDSDFTKIASIGHNSMKISTDAMDILETKINEKSIPLKSIGLNITDNTINVNDVFKLVVTFDPEDTTDDKTIKWRSSDESIALVDVNGEVTGLSQGIAYIYAQVGNLEACCKVTVNAPVVSLQKIELNKTESTLIEGQKELLTVKFLPENTNFKGKLTWESSDTSVATVNNGEVVGVNAGETIITVKAIDGENTYTSTCNVIVKEIPENTIVIDTKDFDLSIGRTRTLKLISKNIDISNVEWKSSDSSIVSIDENGVVKALKEGKVTITAKIQDKIATIEVNSIYKKITSISIGLKDNVLKVGDTSDIIVNILPEDASLPLDYNITSSDPDIISVDGNEKVIAKKAGKVILTAKAGSGSIGQIEVEVVEKTSKTPKTGDMFIVKLR